MANKMFPQRHMTYIGQIENKKDDAYAQSERERIFIPSIKKILMRVYTILDMCSSSKKAGKSGLFWDFDVENGLLWNILGPRKLQILQKIKCFQTCTISTNGFIILKFT